jgi:3-hydroxyisobutyrate dehydrogenase
MARIGWIGTGVMGLPMCGHVMDAGHEVSVHNRTRERAAPLVERGAAWCDSPADVAKGADVVFTMLGFPADVRAVVLDSGLLEAMAPGTVYVDVTTSEPSLAVEIAEAASTRGVEALDAPVSGGDVGARGGTLVVMVGGSDEGFGHAKPFLETFGKTIVHLGGPGSGQHTKMVNQIAISSGMVAVCEALLYAHRSGLDPETVLDTISQGAAGSWSLSNYGPRLLGGDLKPGFKIDHFIKDLGIALSEARRMNLSLPGLALAEQLYVAARAQGHGQDGTQALLVALAHLSSVDWPYGEG